MEVEDPTTPTMAITPVTPTDNNEPLTSEEQPNKRRRKKSIVWEHFTIETVGAGCMRACCKQCKKSFAYITGSKLAGTSHLKRHISLGICPVSRQKNEASTPGSKTDPPKKRYRASPGFSGIPFDQERCNHDIAKMIIQHDYPLHIVEHPAFIDFVRTLQPQYNMVSFNTIQGECVAVYLREKQSLLDLISGIPGRVSLTLDLGSSNLNIGYAILTGHFIDADWNLQRRILNVAMVPFPDSDFAFNQAVVSCLSDWHLESKLFTLTLDQSFANETIVGNLRGHLSVKNPFVLNGQLLKGNCYARVLSRLAQDLLGATGEIVKRIRESVKYVKTSEAHDEKFTELRQQLQVPSTKDLIIDDQTKWNTTYQMLVAACELKEVFACLDTSDPVYKINPSDDDWKKVEILCSYLKLLYDAASILTSPTYPPAHVFYHEVYKIQLELTHHAASPDPFVSKLTKPLKVKFDQYWKECFLVLAIAVVMDPRFKMKLLEFSFPKVFGEDAGMWIKVIDDGIHELFLDYLGPNLHLPATFVEEGHMDIPQPDTQKVELTPAEDEQSQGVLPQEAVPPQEVPLQVVHPEKATPQEVPLQDDHHQEASPQEMHPQEQEVASRAVPSEETHTEVASQKVSNHEIKIEVSCQAAPSEEMHTAQVPSQEVSNHETNIEVSSQEVVPQEKHPQEATPQVTQAEEVPSQEMHALEAPPQEKQSEEVPSQEVPPEQMQTKEVPSQEAPTQDIHTEEPPSQELPPQEIQTEVPSQEVPVEKMETEEVLPSCEVSNHETKVEVSSQEVVPEEMHLQEATPHVTKSEEVPSQEMHALETLPQEKQSEEVPSQALPPEQMQTKEVPSQVAPTQDIHAEEAPSLELPQEIQTEVPSQEVPVEKMETDEVPPQETQTEEVPPQERQTEELPPQERQTEEVLPQDTQLEEVPPQERQTEEALPQETQLEEVPPQDMQTEELPPQEMHSEVLPEEMQLQVIHQEMQPQELHTQDLPMLTIGDGLSDFDIYISEITSGQHLKSELDQYLEESLLPRVHEFDVLGWWKLNRLKYPTLSKMAADILSIPISTVAPDSVFDTENRKIDNYRSSLRPVTLEALICAKDWLQYGSSSSSISQEFSNAIVKAEY